MFEPEGGSSGFDLADPNLTSIDHAESPLPNTAVQGEEQPTSTDPLDEPQAIELHSKLLDSYTRELDRQEENRNEQAEDEDAYDGIMWDPTDAAELIERGQQPLVFNVIATTINWILGTERRTRSDFHILPRRKEDGKPAEKKTQILKYLSDCNRTPFHRSRAFADTVKVGLGWIEQFVEMDSENEPIKARYESWRNILYDSAATELDLEDGRYEFRTKWTDVDVARAWFPNRAGVIDLSKRDAEPLLFLKSDYGDEAMDNAERELDRTGTSARMPNRYVRERVRLIEAWFKVPEDVERLNGGPFHGELFDRSSPAHVQHVNEGVSQLVTRKAMRVWVAVMTATGLLWLGRSPYRHNRYPFTPIWGNRRGRNGLPYGAIRNLKDVNFDLNKRASKALYHLSVNRKIVDEGAAEDMDELFDELDRPDARVIKRTGKEVKVENGEQLATAQLQLMHEDIAMIERTGGVTDENLGRKTNATSGIAIERRQDQGGLTTAHYFDNLRFSMQVMGEKELSLVEQWMTDQKQFRITNMRGKPDYVTVNDGEPENDITRAKADFVITEADWRASIRQASADQLMELMMKLAPVNPQLVMVMLDLVVESTDIPNREEIVRRIRDLTGMQDPDKEQTPQEQQAQAAAKQKQAAMQEAVQQANLRKLVSEAVKNEMTAVKLGADTTVANITAIGGPKRGAVDIAADLMGQPKAAPVADEILKEAGFVTRTEKEQSAFQEQQAQALPQPAQAAPPAAAGLTPPANGEPIQ